ncbi:disease resistance protein RPM1-like [Rhododendron vialii]|uniref:disease resistance protein RPM1-like n=1 Tax=Rhododendron vialii TaxID=182163 RepID=UPI00265DC421|nr:disease resistance protein RPM1-like [Rhododendron vialii]
MGGCGKTTLAKKIFDNQKVVEHFDCQAWILVSQSYKMEDILRRVMKQLCQTRKECTPGGIDAMDQNSLIHMLREYLLQKRYLIVFDDKWSTEFWRVVKLALPKNSKGSQIIVTTRSQNVASFCKESSSDHVCKLEPLIQEEAWKLFCMKTFQRDFGGHCPPELEKVSRAIVRKCEGLPLAIVTIGALLSTKSKVESKWQRFYDSLGSELEWNSDLTNVTKNCVA